MNTKGVAAVLLLEDFWSDLHYLKKGAYESSAEFFIEYWWWFIRVYPVGLDHVNIKQDHSAFELWRLDGSEEDVTIWCSYALIKDGKTIKEKNLYSRFENPIMNCHIFSLVEQDELQSGEISLKITISIPSYSLKEKSLRRFKTVVGSLKKEVRLVSGKTSIWVNADLLGISSPVFKAKLDRGQQWLQSQENSIDLGKGNEKYLKDFVDFLQGEEIDLNVRNKSHCEKFRTLTALGDKWVIESILDIILIELTTSPSKDDLVRRLLLLTRFKHIPTFRQGAKSLTLWAYKNMSQKEFMDLTSEVFLSNSEL